MAQVKYAPLNPSRETRFYLTSLVLLTLALSMSANLLQYLSVSSKQYDNTYSDLPKDLLTVITHDNRSIDDELWTDARHVIDHGMVALDDDFVRRHGLLPAQRYPWDPSKSLYYLHGFHSMHCVLVLRDLVMDVRDGRSSSWPHNHLVHCLHSLREDVECYADDFPHYTGRLNDEKDHFITNPGVGETRMCRSWDRFRDFAIAHTACWSKEHWHEGDPVIESYKSCPDGSKPWEDLGIEMDML